MALFFNIEILEQESAGDPDKLITLLRYHHSGSIPSKFYTKYKLSKKPLHGNSFILNPNPILNINTNLDSNYISQYIKLAGRRSYFLYRTHGIKSLDKSLFPDLNLEMIKTNPLLIIETKEIKFKFEEIYNGSKIWRN